MYPRGSEWRRWDLHVHAPGTLLNDQFTNWEEYLRVIQAQDQVRVLGVTDYLSLATYSTLKRHKDEGRIPNIDLLIPNLEFRLAPPTDRATAVNIHLLISPDDPQHEQQINNALGRLTWEFDHLRYSCLPDQLIALGKAFDPQIKDDGAALSMGVLQFKVDFTAFRDWFNAEHWLRKNALVAVAAGADGLSGFRRDGAWAALRDEITRFSQVLFSGRSGEREFWLGHGTDEDGETLKRLGGRRPCLHGSDAHEIARLFRPDEDRFCWIKADPTFEGLRQTLYEPADRVYIGPTPPLYHDDARVIRSVALARSGGWFEDVEIPLNAGLVSIIGQKGSGKSALAEVTAYTAGSWETEGSSSFIKRAGEHLQDLLVTLNWADGERTEGRLGDEQSGNREVRYLSQKFVERLCSDDHIGTELVREIEAVVFSYIDPTETLNASSFDELRALRTEGIHEEGARLREDVARLILEECALRDNARKLREKSNRIKTLTQEREGLAKQIPPPVNEEERRRQEDLQRKRVALATLQQAIAADKQKLQKVADIRAKVNTIRGQVRRFAAELDTLLAEAGVPEADRAPFRPDFSADTEPALTRRVEALQRSVARQEGAAENPAENTLRWLKAQIKALVERETADKARQERIRVLQTRIAAIGTERERVEAEIAQIEGPDKERMAAAYDERLEAYIAYFRSLKDEQDTLEQLYAPVKAHLASATAAPPEQELEFSIRWEADLKTWLERGSVLFDQRRTLPYGTMRELGAAAARILVPAWTSGNADAIRPAMGQFLTEFRSSNLPVRNYLRSEVTAQDLLHWLYELDHIRLTYGLKYNGVELEKLSPGTKGIVLLILYLGMDVADTRPLIVDQPDENLDNESIYQLLTAYFKAAKSRRQIILITHNPNLVVNADSEQVIVAHCERRENGFPNITYHSGALENDHPPEHGIRQQVCRILEGGSDAFRRRERRYALAED